MADRLKIHGSNKKKKKMKQRRKSELRKLGSSYITEPVSKRNMHLEAFYDLIKPELEQLSAPQHYEV